MPGVPRSKACSSCKRRKIKCDQNWPACTQCKHIRSACPGPSSNIKFIHNGNHSVTRHDANPGAHDTAATAFGDTVRAGLSPASTNAQPPSNILRQLVSRKSAVLRGSQASYASFRLVRPDIGTKPATTVAERLAARLIHHLDTAPDRGVVFQVKYMKELPRRLSNKACLRDAVALFCSAWAGFRRGLPASEFIAMDAYGKALRSVRRALQSDQAMSVDTLAAITLLERTECLFDRERPPNRAAHAEGILYLIERHGPPSLDNLLYFGLVFENCGTMMSYWLSGRGAYFLNQPEWREAMELSLVTYAELEELGPIAKETFKFSNDISAVWITMLSKLQVIRRNPFDPQSLELKEDLLCEIRDAEIESRRIVSQLRDKALELGLMTETRDPQSITGWRCNPKTTYMGQLFINLRSMHMIILWAIRDLALMYGSPSDAINDELRNTCLGIWMFIPFMRKLEPVVAMRSIWAFGATLEAANKEEKEYLLDFLVDVDAYQGQLGKDRGEVLESAKRYCALITGRPSVG